MITHEQLINILDYNENTGVFVWKNPSRYSPSMAGEFAGNKNSLGYIAISIDMIKYYGHRLAWLYVHGYFPEGEIDHKNKIRNDNRISNLREVSHQCNLRNSKNSSNNTSGVKGVYWFKRTKRWGAGITIFGKDHHLGYYDDFDDAVCARLAGEQSVNWHGCDSSSPAFCYVRDNIQNEKD